MWSNSIQKLILLFLKLPSLSSAKFPLIQLCNEDICYQRFRMKLRSVRVDLGSYFSALTKIPSMFKQQIFIDTTIAIFVDGVSDAKILCTPGKICLDLAACSPSRSSRCFPCLSSDLRSRPRHYWALTRWPLPPSTSFLDRATVIFGNNFEYTADWRHGYRLYRQIGHGNNSHLALSGGLDNDIVWANMVNFRWTIYRVSVVYSQFLVR